MLFNIINVSISSPVLGCCHCTHLKGCLWKEKEEIREREMTKMVLKEMEKACGKIFYPIGSSGLLENIYPPQV